MQRRRLLQTGSAVGALGLMSACATLGGHKPQVVVIGAGYAGATAAKYIRMWSGQAIEVTVVEPNAAFVSCPLSNLVVGGSQSMADITLPYDNLVKRHGVKWAQDRVSTIDVARRRVKLAGGGELPYDRLIVSPGVDFVWDSLPGMNQAGAQEKNFARLESRPANPGAAPAAPSHARRGRVCHHDSAGTLPLPARAL